MLMDNLGPKLSAEGLEWAGYPYDSSRETTTAKAHFTGDETIEVHFSSFGDPWRPSRFPYTIKRDGAKFTVSANIDQGTLSTADAYSIVARDMNEILQSLQKQKSTRASWKVSKAEQK